jgi:hypothetical protein
MLNSYVLLSSFFFNSSFPGSDAQQWRSAAAQQPAAQQASPGGEEVCQWLGMAAAKARHTGGSATGRLLRGVVDETRESDGGSPNASTGPHKWV